MSTRSRHHVPGRHESLAIDARQRVSLGLALAILATFGCTREQPDATKGNEDVLAPPRVVVSSRGRPESTSATLQPEDSAALAGQELPKTTLPIYELKIAAKDLAALEQSAFSNQVVPAKFIAGTNTHTVQVRYRGAWARTWPKKPFKIFFSKDQPFEGQRRLNLNSAWRDPAVIRECLAYHIYEACRAPAPRSRLVRLNLNGQFLGLYVQVEQPDKAFVNARSLKGASVYKAASRANQADERDLGNEQAYRRHYEKQTGQNESYEELQQFCRELAKSTDPLEFFTRRVDIEKYVNYLAATVLTQNWDGFNKNHYLIYDGQGSQKWFVAPWDLDRTLGDHWNWSFNEAHLPIMLGTRRSPGVTGWNRMQDRFLSHPVLRARLLDRLNELLQDEFTTDKLFPIVDRLEAEIAPDAALDQKRWPGPKPDLHRGIKELKRFLERRRAYLLDAVPRLRAEAR